MNLTYKKIIYASWASLFISSTQAADNSTSTNTALPIVQTIGAYVGPFKVHFGDTLQVLLPEILRVWRRHVEFRLIDASGDVYMKLRKALKKLLVII